MKIKDGKSSKVKKLTKEKLKLDAPLEEFEQKKVIFFNTNIIYQFNCNIILIKIQ